MRRARFNLRLQYLDINTQRERERVKEPEYDRKRENERARERENERESEKKEREPINSGSTQYNSQQKVQSYTQPTDRIELK